MKPPSDLQSQRFFLLRVSWFPGLHTTLGVGVDGLSVIWREYGRLGRKRATAKALSVLSRHRDFTHSSSLSSTQMGGVLRQKTPCPKRVNGCLAPAILPLFTGSCRVNMGQVLNTQSWRHRCRCVNFSSNFCARKRDSGSPGGPT